MIGDVNLDGKISVQDIILLSKYVAKKVDLNEAQKKAAECCTDGEINSGDITTLMAYVVEFVEALPQSSVPSVS